MPGLSLVAGPAGTTAAADHLATVDRVGRHFPDYRVVTMADAPRIETHLVASARPPGGVGEPGTPPIAPALANALFALTGRRIRSLPLSA